METSVKTIEADEDLVKVAKKVIAMVKGNEFVKQAVIACECNRRGITKTNVTLTWVEPGKNQGT